MTDTIAELRELLGKATAGDWAIVPYSDGDSLVIHRGRSELRVCFMATPDNRDDFEGIKANARLIVAMRNALPALLDRVEAGESEATALRIAWWNDMRQRGVGQDAATLKIKAALTPANKEPSHE